VADDFTTINAWKNRDGLRKVMKNFRAAFSKLLKKAGGGSFPSPPTGRFRRN